MAVNFNCLGLEELIEDDPLFKNGVYDILDKGKEIRGYSGNSYYMKNYGSAEFVVRTEYEKEERKLVVLGVDTHTQGRCVWDVRISAPNADPEDSDQMQKRVLVHHAEKGTGLAMVNLVNADVLPSYMSDDLLHMQIVGLAEGIEYYETAEEFEESLSKPDIGYRTIPADGLVMASGYLRNRNPDFEDYGTRPELEDINLVRGTVTELLYGTFDIGDGEEPYTPYIRCFIETEFGELEIEHTIGQVSEEQRKNMEIGATVVASVVLSGDVAIDEYEDGAVLDEDHDLSLLRYSMVKGPLSRFLARVADDCVYISDVSEKELTDRCEIEKHMRFVKQSEDHVTHVYRAILEEPYEPVSQYPAGRKCLAIAYDDPKDFEQLIFLDYDENQMITRILLTSDRRFRFRIEEKPIYERDRVKERLDIPENFFDAMLLRAQCIIGLQCESLDIDIIRDSQRYDDYKNNALEAMKEAEESNFTDIEELEDKYYNAFGTLFAKALGMEGHERAYWMGRQFYRDYVRYHNKLDINEDYFRDEMTEALVYAQMIGEQMKIEQQDRKQ